MMHGPLKQKLVNNSKAWTYAWRYPENLGATHPCRMKTSLFPLNLVSLALENTTDLLTQPPTYPCRNEHI
jgi:hypothetical protein